MESDRAPGSHDMGMPVYASSTDTDPFSGSVIVCPFNPNPNPRDTSVNI